MHEIDLLVSYLREHVEVTNVLITGGDPLVMSTTMLRKNTGPRAYFEVPLAESLRIFSDAFVHLSGLGRTVRGPVMSATPGKVLVVGAATVNDQRVFVLKMIQGRDPEWVDHVFLPGSTLRRRGSTSSNPHSAGRSSSSSRLCGK
jgi:L-lysine 2,3-aminomutase